MTTILRTACVLCILALAFTPASAQLFGQDKDKGQTEKQEEKPGLLSIFSKKENTESEQEMEAVKARQQDARSDVRISRRERKAAEAREEAARARARALKAEKQALKAEKKASRYDDKADKARTKAAEEEGENANGGLRSLFRKDGH